MALAALAVTTTLAATAAPPTRSPAARSRRRPPPPWPTSRRARPASTCWRAPRPRRGPRRPRRRRQARGAAEARRTHWITVARATTRQGGTFRASYRPPRPTSAMLRIAAGAHRHTLGRLNAYRRTTVSWYGPGPVRQQAVLRRAPDAEHDRRRQQVAAVRHEADPAQAARIIRARVVDRGPYVGGREFDLTSATRQRLHFSGVGVVTGEPRAERSSFARLAARTRGRVVQS